MVLSPLHVVLFEKSVIDAEFHVPHEFVYCRITSPANERGVESRSCQCSRLPALELDFIATQMHVLIRKNTRYFAEELLQEVKRRISTGIHWSEFAIGFAERVAVSQDVNALTPGESVTRRIEFDEHTNAALSGELDQLSDLCL